MANSSKKKPVDTDEVKVLSKLVDRLHDKLIDLSAHMKMQDAKIETLIQVVNQLNNVKQDEEDWDVPEGAEDPAQDDLDKIVNSL